MKPRIGITTFCEPKPRKPFTSVSHNYVTSVILGGGIPVLIPILNSANDLEAYMDFIDGILLTGGEDVSPLEYGENPTNQISLVCKDRDVHEIRLFKMAWEKRIPVLGICRGLQLINVARGGSLFQDIGTQVPGSLGHDPENNPVDELYHNIKLEKDSRLHNIFKTSELEVNSFHHQAVKLIGEGLKAVAHSDEGIVEGIETIDDSRFVIGVQWHPEDLTIRYPKFVKLFSEFIDECGKLGNKDGA